MKYGGWCPGTALAYNNNLLLVSYNVNNHIQIFQIYSLEGFFVTSYENVVKIDPSFISDLRFTNDFILASFKNLCLIRISDYNIKQRLASSNSFRSLLDSDDYGNFYAIEEYDSEYKIGIYSFDLEFLQLFNNDLRHYGCPLSLCIKEDTMFVVSDINDTSLITLFKVDLTNGKIIDEKKLNTRLIFRPIYLFVDDMYNVFISCALTAHICIYYASGRIRYFMTDELEGYQNCKGIAYAANCNSIFVLTSPHIKIYSLALCS